jgi:hypothetical protein
MKSENYIRCYEVLREEINNLAKLDCKIHDMERNKQKVTKATLDREKSNYALMMEHFRGLCDMANITGEFTYLDGRSAIDSEFGWIFQ